MLGLILRFGARLQNLWRDPDDHVPDVRAQHEPGVFAHPSDLFVEFELVVRVGGQDAVFAQQGNKLPEQVAVREFRGGDFV